MDSTNPPMPEPHVRERVAFGAAGLPLLGGRDRHLAWAASR